MKNIYSNLLYLLFLMLIPLLSCKKEEDEFDTPPTPTMNCTAIFTPEFTATHTTNQYNMEGSGTIRKVTYSLTGENTRFTFDGWFKGKYLNENTGRLEDVFYSFELYTPLMEYFATLEERTYLYSAIRSTSWPKYLGETGIAKSNENNSDIKGLWNGTSSAISAPYVQFEECFSKITISKTYRLTLASGKSILYADGNFEATLLGGTPEPLRHLGQLHLKGNFTGFEIGD